MIASAAILIASNNIAYPRNNLHIGLVGKVAGWRPTKMRMFETVASTMLVLAAQALVVGVVVTTL